MAERKPNRLREYDYSQNGVYFVTICAQSRRRIFSEITGDGFVVLKAYGKIAEEFIAELSEKYISVLVDKYVIMPDHIHLLLRLSLGNGTGDPSPTLGNVIGWYKYQVTKKANLCKNARKEKLFQRSYYDHVVRNQKDYDEIWQYIENNPRKWWLEHQRNE